MKKLLLMAVSVGLLTACEKSIIDEFTGEDVPTSSEVKTKKFTFTLKGDFSTEWKLNTNGPIAVGNAADAASRATRGYLQADGKDMTDVWVLDYVGTECQQTLHLTSADANFGSPSLSLSYGSHHVYIIASRGEGAVVDTAAHSITFTKVLDTFWKDYQVEVAKTSNGNRAVTLDRIVTKLRFEFTDEVPANIGTIGMETGRWYFGFDYMTGEPSHEGREYTSSLAIPDGYVGRNDLAMNYYSFSPSTDWKTNVTVTSRNIQGDIINQAKITDASMQRNRVTTYAGPLFTSTTDLAIGLKSEWNPENRNNF